MSSTQSEWVARPARILGIDPGSRNMGWAVLLCPEGAVPRLLDFGVIKTKPKTPQPATLLQLLGGLEDLVSRFGPHAIALEDIFFSGNASSAMRVGEARGMVLLTAAQHGLELASYTPQQLKIAAAGHGRASKEEVQDGIQSRLGLPVAITNEHAADAVAAALRHYDQIVASQA
jgi:crossover junction endodeoxyribonuclease RuvC